MWAYDPRVKNPLALGLVLLGSLAMVIATFLPLNESGTYRRIEDNTLIQNGGWMLIALALWIAIGGYFVDQGAKGWLSSSCLCPRSALVIFTASPPELKPSTLSALMAIPTRVCLNTAPWGSESISLA